MEHKPVFITLPLVPKVKDLMELTKEIFDSRTLTNMGPKHKEFETRLENVLKVPHVSLFNNGTIALLAAIKAFDLPVGSEVITTPLTFAATPHCISWNGLVPVFADIEPETMTISPDSIERAITSQTRAIVAVHVYGFPCDVKRIEVIAKKYNLKVIYDAAHAFSTEIEGKGIGTFGDITMFSFHATKLFNTIEGGCLTYNDDSLYHKINNLRNFGIQSEEIIEEVGINGKMNELQAAIGLLNLNIFEEEKKRRSLLKHFYDQGLSSIAGIKIPKLPENTCNSYQYYPIVIEQKYPISCWQLHERFKEENIFTRRYFYPLCIDYKCYGEQNLRNGTTLDVAISVGKKVLCLPFYGELPEEIQHKIVSIIASY